MWKSLLLGSIVAILFLFALGLRNDPRFIPSPLENRPAPHFIAPTLDGKNQVRFPQDFPNKWVLVNFWGSWCGGCAMEHPYLMLLAKKTQTTPDFAMVGVDFKDTLENANLFLRQYGNPGYPQAFDPNQRIAIDWGVYGAPESYLVDPSGRIVLKVTGMLQEGWFEKEVLPRIQAGKKP
ncbi:MAG: DsbE family thiol:disulfide interchange protein [Magnetococcales bacterium]|nr:DsbE family thiol:disulfide interchange protein [Magnetococcales bacterium]